MDHILWVAKLSDEEWEQVSDRDLEQMCDDLDIFFDQLKDQHLDKGG